MIKEITPEQFAKGIKNPFFDKLCKKVEVSMSNEDYDFYVKYAEMYGIRPTDVMRRALWHYAKMMREED